MHDVISLAQLEAAINRCLSAQPPVEHALGADARQLAEVYGECIFARAQNVDLARHPKSAATVRKWLA